MNADTPLAQVMTTRLLTVRECDSMEMVHRIFQKHDIHHVPVENEKGELAGIVSRSDFLKISFGMSLFNNPERDNYNTALYKSMLVRDVMTKMVVALSPRDTVRVAANIFRENLFHAIPITEKERIVGIVTTYDLLNFAFRNEPKVSFVESLPV